MNGRTARALARQRPLARAAWRVVETAGGRWPKRTAALRCWPGPPGGLFLTVPGRRCDRPAGRGRGADDGDGRGRDGSVPDRLAGGRVSRRDGLGGPPFAAAAPPDGDASLSGSARQAGGAGSAPGGGPRGAPTVNVRGLNVIEDF